MWRVPSPRIGASRCCIPPLGSAQVRGDAARGTLRFEPLHLQRVDASADTVQFAPHAFQALLGLANVTGVEVLAM